MADVIAFGEAMLEVGLTGPAQAALGYAGDTLNTAVYMRRLGRSAAYATAVGKGDPFSQGVLNLMDAEGVDRSLVEEVEGRLPGVYAFDRDPTGERRFFYWRSESPAREYFDHCDYAKLSAAVAAAKLVYISGITLAIIGPGGRATLMRLLGEAHEKGIAVAFDPNYRQRLWPDVEDARAALDAVIPLCRYVSTGVNDLVAMYGDDGGDQGRLWSEHGAEVVIRADDHAVTVWSDGKPTHFSPEPRVRALDTTGAGDAFNAGFLAARLSERELSQSVHIARRLANFVVQHIGAIIPRAAMPPLERAV